MILRELSENHYISLEALKLKASERETVKLIGGFRGGAKIDIVPGAIALEICTTSIEDSSDAISNMQSYYREHPTSKIFEHRQWYRKNEQECPI